MENLGKIDSAKDLVTKEWVEAQDFLPSSAFTKNGIKNALGIADWALAASKPSYNFSEIGNKPTTLSGYGITDAVKQGVNFSPTSATSPTIIGYSGIGEGWPAGGPAMRWGTDGYYARLQVELNTNNPRLLLSGVYNNTAYEWVEILTDKNFSSFGIANMSNDASGSANDILTSSVNGVIERLTDIPIRYGSLLTFAAKNAFYRGQLIINYQSDMAIRCHDGRWSDWAKVVTDKNFASYGVKAGNFNTTGSANDITVPSIVGDFESLQNMPFHYCNVLTITTTPHYYVGQIAIDYTGRMAVRGQDYDGVTWSSWRTILDTNNIGDYAMSKAGGTIDGNLTINGKFKTQTTLGHVSLFSNIFEVNASLKVLSGWALYLNGKGIQQWSDLGTYITPISSETTSAKTISPNTFYKWGSVSALSITLGAATNNTHINNYMFEFTASTGFPLGGLSGVKWADGVKPNIKAGYTYQFSIINNCATYSAFKTA